MPFTPIGLIFIILTVLLALLTIRVAYVTYHQDVRDRILAKHKTRHGQLAFDGYSKVYSWRAVLSMSLIVFWLVLRLISEIIEAHQGDNSVLSLVVGYIGFAAGMTGLFMFPAGVKRGAK